MVAVGRAFLHKRGRYVPDFAVFRVFNLFPSCKHGIAGPRYRVDSEVKRPGFNCSVRDKIGHERGSNSGGIDG